MKKIAIAATTSITTVLPPGDLRHVDGGCGRRGSQRGAAPDTAKGGSRSPSSGQNGTSGDDVDSAKGGDAAPRDASEPSYRC
jgi:hypothetical protein